MNQNFCGHFTQFRPNSMKFFAVVHFLFYSVNVATIVDNNEDKQDLPSFIKEPPSVVYYPFSEREFEINEQPAAFDLEAIVYPSNSTVTIATSVPDDPENYLFLPVLRTSSHVDHSSSSVSFHQPYAILYTTSQQVTQPHDTHVWKARVYNLLPNAMLHLLASTSSGTVRSRPIRLIHTELPGFPRFADESLSLLIGNTGRLVCHLPRAQPSLPVVSFYQNGIRLDLSDGMRYRLIYLGGDGTAIPWEERVLKSQRLHQPAQKTQSNGGNEVYDTIFHKPVPSAAVLLIHPLQLTDSGEYRCQARIGSREVFSEQRTILNVSKPHEKVPVRLQFSSDDPEISYLYGHLVTSSSSTSSLSSSAPDLTHEKDGALADLKSIATSKNLISIGGRSNNADGSMVISSTPTRVLMVPEGMNLTLFCTYESAPIVSTRWFFDAPQSNVYQDGRFGVLMISRVTKNNEATYTCSPNIPALETTRKSFKILVKQRKLLKMEPGPKVTVGTGQNISLRCGYQKTKHQAHSSKEFSALPTTSHDSDSDFRHLTLGTDLGWYHDGKSIGIKQKYDKTFIEVNTDGTRLHIINISNYDQGIYQCWKIDDTGAWSTASSVVTMGSATRHENEMQEARAGEGITQERTREGLTGHMTCNVSAILRKGPLKRTDSGIQPNDVVIVWYRGASDSEPIDLSSNQFGGIKYLRTTVDWASQILSVVNPRKSKDDGLYACKVYDRSTNSVLGEMKFELIIDSERKIVPEDTPKEMESKALTSVQAKNDHMKIQTVMGEISNIQDISSRIKSALKREFPISTPKIRRLANFTTGIHVSWLLSDRTVASQIERFEVELRMLKSTTEGRSMRIRRSETALRASLLPFSVDETYWTLPSRIANAGVKNEICLAENKGIQAGRVYSVRIVGIVRPEDQIEFTSEIAVKSPWSNRISFENLVGLQPTITTLLAVNRTQLKLEWTLPTRSSWDLPVQLSNGAIYVHFQALLTPLVLDKNYSYPQKSRWKSCYQGTDGASEKTSLKQSFLGSWHLNGDGRNWKPFRSTISNLRSNTTYAVAIYGLLSPLEQQNVEHNAPRWYTLLSAEAIEQTLIVDNGETRTPLDRADKDAKKTANANTAEIMNRIDNADSKSPADQESHILVVILGSLAGVLLVISLALIGLCIWYHLRTKRLVYQEAIESPNKLGMTTSSLELSSTPNAYLVNTTNPVLNFMDSSYQGVQFTGSPQMQHLGITNPSLRQLAELQSLYQFPGYSPPHNWSTVPFNPAEEIHQQVLQQQHQQSEKQQTWLNAGLVKSSGSKGITLPGPYPYEKGPNPVQSAVHHQSHRQTGNEQELDSLLRRNSDLSEKAAHSNELKRDQFVAFIGSPNDNLSSPDASDDNEGDEARIIQNDQSSSIYSHIGSESTLNELPPKLLDRQGCFSPQPPPPPPIGAGLLGRLALFTPQVTHAGVFQASGNPQIQRPIPMYLSATSTHPQIPSSDLWNTGILPVNLGASSNWLNYPAVQASLLARQQSVPFGHYTPMVMDSTLMPSQYPITQPPAMFYRTLPNRRTLDLTPRNSVATITTAVAATGTTATMMDQRLPIQDPLLRFQSNEWPHGTGIHVENEPLFDPKAAFSLGRDQLGQESDLDHLDDDHPNAQFVPKSWMDNSSKPDSLREASCAGAPRQVQTSSKPPSSAESGRGSRPSGVGSERSNSGEERKHHELARTFGDSGVDLHASVNNEVELSQLSRKKADEPPDKNKRLDQTIENKGTKFTKPGRFRPYKTVNQTNSTRMTEDEVNSTAGGSTTDKHDNRRHRHNELSSQSSLDSSGCKRCDGDQPKSVDHLESDTWQLRDPCGRKEAITKPVSPSAEAPSISSSI